MNLAVNNLLSRDDEGEDDLDDSGDPYMSGQYRRLKAVQEWEQFDMINTRIYAVFLQWDN